jgi:serine phosphatase RsbU (regulator of sigma subunit)/ligand-binding sensor protein
LSEASHPKVKLRLTDFVDVQTLQKLQDAFARVANVGTSIRDAEGHLLTEPSLASSFCSILRANPAFRERCRRSHEEHNRAGAGAMAALCICHAGLAQYAAPIELDGQRLGTIIIGDRPHEPLTDARIRQIADAYGADYQELQAAAAQLVPWEDEQMQSAIDLLRLIANTIARLCWQQYQLRQQLASLSALQSVSGLVTSGKGLQEILNLIARTMVKTMRVRGCTVRMLDDEQEELVIRAVAGLSRRYLQKGPVLVEQSQLDQMALRGQLVKIADLRTDPRVLYPQEARDEGLVSGLVAGLHFRGAPLGTVHIYTGEPHEFTRQQTELFSALANQAANAIANARLQAEQIEKVRIERQLRVAAEVQRRMIPAAPPQFAGYDIAGLYLPSQQLGGDFYDFLPLGEEGENLGVAICDVVGKGVPAALLMSSVRTSLRAHAAYRYRIDHVVDQVNRTLCSHTLAGEFATLFYGVINAPQSTLTYCNAGHDPPLLIRGGQVNALDVGGMVVGVQPEAAYQMGIIELQPGDMLVLYTDGVVNAMNFDGQEFGRQRLVDGATALGGRAAEQVVMGLLWNVRRFIGLHKRTDDLTLVVIKVPAKNP